MQKVCSKGVVVVEEEEVEVEVVVIVVVVVVREIATTKEIFYHVTNMIS